MIDQTYTVAAVAERYHVSSNTVLRWIRSGRLRGINVSAKKGSKKPRFVIRSDSLEAFELERGEGATLPAVKSKYKLPAGTKRFV